MVKNGKFINFYMQFYLIILLFLFVSLKNKYINIIIPFIIINLTN